MSAQWNPPTEKPPSEEYLALQLKPPLAPRLIIGFYANGKWFKVGFVEIAQWQIVGWVLLPALDSRQEVTSNDNG